MASLKSGVSSDILGPATLRGPACLRVVSDYQDECQDDQPEQRTEHDQCAHGNSLDVVQPGFGSMAAIGWTVRTDDERNRAEASARCIAGWVASENSRRQPDGIRALEDPEARPSESATYQLATYEGEPPMAITSFGLENTLDVVAGAHNGSRVSKQRERTR